MGAGQDRKEAEDDLFMWSLKRCGRAVPAEHSQQLPDETEGGSYGNRCGHHLVCWLFLFKLDPELYLYQWKTEASEFLGREWEGTREVVEQGYRDYWKNKEKKVFFANNLCLYTYSKMLQKCCWGTV